MKEKIENTNFEFLINESQRRKKRKELLVLLEHENIQKKNPIRFFNSYITKYAIAVVLVLTIWTGINNINSETTHQLAIDFIAKTNTSTLNEVYYRSVEDGLVNNSSENANIALMEGNYNEAILLYEILEKSNGLNNNEKFNYAMAILKNEKSDYFKAVTLLQSIEQASSGTEIERQWLLGLSYTLLKKDEEAKTCFHKIQLSSQYKSEEINKILTKIK